MNDSCDHHLEIVSECLDEERALPEPTLDHLSQCDECRAFHDMWKEDEGPLAKAAGFRDLPEVPTSLAEGISAERKTIAGPWRRNLRHWRPALAAALIVAAGLAWWNSGRDTTNNNNTNNNGLVENGPGDQQEPSDKVDLPQAISKIDTSSVKRGFSIYTRARARSLDRRSHRLVQLTLNIRDATTNLSGLVPTVE
jgi:hypothetical protein